MLSLVPAGGADIRDTPPDTFADVDARMFRGSLLIIAGMVALVLGGLLLLGVVVRTALRRRAVSVAAPAVVSPALALRAASRELASVESVVRQDGWTGDLAGRAAAALRLAGAVALGQSIGHRLVGREEPVGEGQIAVPRGFGRKKLLLSAATTPARPAMGAAGSNGSHDPIWNGISRTLAALTATRYSRNGAPDAPALDNAVAEGRDLIARLRRQTLLRLRRRTAGAREQPRPTWER